MKNFASFYDSSFDEEDLKPMLASAKQAGLMSKEDKAKLDSLSGGGEETPTEITADMVIEDESHRFVTDEEKAVWAAKADPIPASTQADGLLCKEDKAKLETIEQGANCYTHPDTHPATSIEEDAEHRFVTDVEKATWNETIRRTEMGASNGVATLDEEGKVPAAQLPSYVDDILEFDNFSLFPTTGESGKIYVDIADSKNYRWSGTQYTVIGNDIALGETASTAYPGDLGKMTTDEVAKIKDGTTIVPKAEDANTIAGFTVGANVPADAVFTDTVYTHPETHEAAMITEDAEHRFVTDAKVAEWDAKPDTDTVYEHPETHEATMIVEDETHRFVTDEEKAAWTAKPDTDTTYEVVTVETDGLMSKEDKAKIDAIHHDTQVEPYYDEATNTVYACGVGITIEAAETVGKNKVTWVSNNGRKSFETNENTYIFGGGEAIDKIVDYPSTSIVINGGTFRVIYAGNKGAGNIGKATIIVNGGKFVEGINGGGAGYTGSSRIASIGHTEIVINNTDSEILTVYGGGMGDGSVIGSAKVTLNGGAVNYLTAGGSNGHTSIGEVVVNGGSVKVLQGCNRGTMGNIKLTVNDGTIGKVYAGGETEDKNVTATYAKADVVVNGGAITAITAGTNGGVADATKVSGTYVDGVIADDAATAMNLAKVTTLEKVAAGLITNVVLEDKVLVLKNGETVIASVDLSAITV